MNKEFLLKEIRNRQGSLVQAKEIFSKLPDELFEIADLSVGLFEEVEIDLKKVEDITKVRQLLRQTFPEWKDELLWVGATSKNSYILKWGFVTNKVTSSLSRIEIRAYPSELPASLAKKFKDCKIVEQPTVTYRLVCNPEKGE